MKNYIEVSMENYCIQELECRCNECNNQFPEYMPLNYELVCFKDDVEKKYFWPTFGKYGYLDLLDKLVDEWHPNENITKHIVEQFEKNLDKFTQHKVSMFDSNIQCPFCKNNNILISKRNTLVNYPVDWLKIDIDSIQDL